MSDNWIRVWLEDTPLWVEPAALLPDGDGALAPEDHIKDGDLDYSRCFSSPSFAHICSDGSIMRYGAVIGHRSDLIREAEVIQ